MRLSLGDRIHGFAPLLSVLLANLNALWSLLLDIDTALSLHFSVILCSFTVQSALPQYPLCVHLLSHDARSTCDLFWAMSLLKGTSCCWDALYNIPFSTAHRSWKGLFNLGRHAVDSHCTVSFQQNSSSILQSWRSLRSRACTHRGATHDALCPGARVCLCRHRVRLGCASA